MFFHCHKPGHVIANCLTLKRKEQQQSSPSAPRAKGIGVVQAERCLNIDAGDSEIDACFKPFIFDGLVWLTGEAGNQRQVSIMPNTGGSQSVILVGALPFSEHSACGYRAVLCGIEMGYRPQPVHRIHLLSKLIKVDSKL